MLRDVELFKSRISKLDAAADLGDYLVKIVSDKTVVPEKEPSAKSTESSEAAGSTKASSESNPQDDTPSTEKT